MPRVGGENGLVQIIGIKADDFTKIQHHVLWHFQSFEDRSNGQALACDLAREVMTADRQCWLAEDDGEVRACALTQVVDGRMRVVEITHCAGQGREDWQQPLIEEITEWAKHIGAGRLISINRPGHTKFLKTMGFRETHRVMEHEL